MEIEAVIQYGCPNWTPIFFIEGNGLKEMEALKKDLGSVPALYPTPLVLVGAMVDGKPNWVLAGHVGIMGHDHIMVSLSQTHYTNRGIRAHGMLSVHMVEEDLLKKADLAGCVSGAKVDKSTLFPYSVTQEGVPVIDQSRLTMVCAVERNDPTPGFDNFILKILHTYADEAILTPNGRIDYDSFKPVLFEMPGYTYLRTGETIAKCMSLNAK